MWDIYLKFIRQQPCAICSDDTGSDPHHEVGNKRRGVGFKSHDIRAIPLCRTHHSELHSGGHATFEMKYGVSQCEIIVDTIERAIYQGVIQIAKEKI